MNRGATAGASGTQHDVRPLLGDNATLVAGLRAEAEHAEAAGHRELARRRYESALYLLRGAEQAGEASVILRRIGRLYFDDGDFAAGLDCLTAALCTAEALGDASLVAYANNVMAIGHWQRGLLEEAERLYTAAFDAARRASDTRLAAMVDQNLGIIANMRGDLPRAICASARLPSTMSAVLTSPQAAQMARAS